MILWCLHCERTFKKGTERTVVERGLELSHCHYAGCDGSEIDFWEWETVRTPYEKDLDRETYPEIPIYGKVYPLYSNKSKD